MTRIFANPGRSPVYGTNGMVATSHPLATTTAISILKKGGNAVDAAIAASACLCVVEPYMTGIGGDCFVILSEPDGKIHGLNGSGRAPIKGDAGQLRSSGLNSISHDSVHSITVPGAVKAWETLHQRFGSLDFSRLFEDAIAYGRDGFVISPRVASDWKILEPELQENPVASQHFLRSGKAPETGAMFSCEPLAKAFDAIAKNGASGFYQGDIAADIISTVQSHGGVMDHEDLEKVTADWVDTISTKYRGHEVHEIPPNGQGLTALVMLRLLDQFKLPELKCSAQRLHQLVESARLAYSIRDAYISDIETMTQSVADILSDKHIGELARSFDPERRNNQIILPQLPSSDTVYLTVVDKDQRAVSFINSLYHGFGSKIVTPQHAIALQCRGACFNLIEGHPNEYGSAKRPLHTIIPAMVQERGKTKWSFGVMGGAYQPMGHAHVLSNMLDYGMDEQEALDAPRLFWNEENLLEAEPGIGKENCEILRALGHDVVGNGLHGGGQIIKIDHERGVLVGASDSRKDGHAAGY